MINQSNIYSSFSVNNIGEAKEFYGKILGLDVEEFSRPGCGPMLTIKLANGGKVLIYPKTDHVPATFTILNFEVEDIEFEVDHLKENGISFLKYEGTDEKGISHNEGPLIAWFKDPAGNFLSVVQEESLEKRWEVKNEDVVQSLTF